MIHVLRQPLIFHLCSARLSCLLIRITLSPVITRLSVRRMHATRSVLSSESYVTNNAPDVIFPIANTFECIIDLNLSGGSHKHMQTLRFDDFDLFFN